MKIDATHDIQKLRMPANIVHIALPLICWSLLVLRWCGFWFIEPWVSIVTIVYYALSAAYIALVFFVRMQVMAIIAMLLLLIASFFIWIPYHWVLTIFLVPSLFIIFYKRGNKFAATVFTPLIGSIVLLVMMFSLITKGLIPEKYTYYTSPNGRYVALEYAFTQIPSGTDVLLCRANGPLLNKERVLYLADYSDFGGKIQWLNDGTILIYGEKMNVFKDPVIKNYTPF